MIAIVVIAAIGATFIPKLIDEVNGFVQALPNYVHDLTHGRGRLGFLERKYHVVEKVREQVQNGGAKKVLGLSGAALTITKSIITIIAATVTIVFLTFFMLLEGRDWVERVYSLLPEESQPRWRRVGGEIYRTIGGYVTGNIVISLIAGASITIVLLIMGVPYAVALGLIVAFLDLIPLAGATVAGIIVALVAFLHSVPAGIVVVVFFIVYQQVENHFLQPVIYGRTVQLSPLAVLVSVLVGAELAGILGALAAIPVAGSLQVIVRDLLAHRRPAPTGVSPLRRPDPPGGCRPRSPVRSWLDRRLCGRSSVHGIRRKQDLRVALACVAALVAVSAPAAVSAPSTNGSTLASLEAGLLQQLNAVRTDHGLVRAAVEREAGRGRGPSIRARWPTTGTSTTTRSTGRRSRRGSRAGTPSRATRAGRSARTCSGRRRASTLSGAVACGCARPAHRANILNPRWREIGIGAVHSTTAGGTFTHLPVTIITTDFGVRR